MISIIIPVYNEQENIELLFNRLISSSKLWNDSFELLFVDDGSSDNSYSLLKEIADRQDNVKIIKLSRNFGHQAAISAGIKLAKGDAAIIMDADLQDPPELLTKFIEEWKNGTEVVYAVRKNRKENIFKKIGYMSFYWILQKIVSDINIPIDAGDFCLMDRKVIDVLNSMTEENRFVRGLRAYAGYNQKGIEYDRPNRASGSPKYTFSKLIRLAIDGILDFSIIPLRIATFLGAFISITSFIIGLFFIIHRILNFKVFGYSPTDTPGLASLAVGIFFLGGVIMFMLGIIGEYIGKIYMEVKNRPSYIIEEIYNENK
jgi:dolichol-phosphate mannosyltransferase